MTDTAEARDMFSELEFTDDTVPDTIPPSEHFDAGLGDAAPTSAYACVVCGIPLDYAGKGRKPKYCAEHKPSRARTSATKTSDATIAAGVLTQTNNLLAVALTVIPYGYAMPATGQAITTASDGFEKAAYEALLASPELARSIARAGGMSGAAGLIMAYAMLAAVVAPVAVAEVKGNLAAKARREDRA